MKQFQILIDKLTDNIANGLLYILTVLIVLVFSTVFFRYVFNMSYIIIQEIIMYLHALIFMFGISYALKENSHVKIDVLYNSLNKRTQRVISIAGLVSFILPTALFIIYISIDMVTQSWMILEGSSEAGGLNLVFILKSLIPISGVLVFLQGISELIKHIRVSRS
ncbi:MAG: TRAP transporter small permease subunit [Gammaproteobacteria bacterium]|tara:strand:+ start:705 stop:1199 length:495 start_codon:yes stop_codon:yes gene_type:complete